MAGTQASVPSASPKPAPERTSTGSPFAGPGRNGCSGLWRNIVALSWSSVNARVMLAPLGFLC
jgi:hypothetical protein